MGNPKDFKFRWTAHRETEKKKRDWYGFINLDRNQAELLHDWLGTQLFNPHLQAEDGEIVLLLSGWNNTGRNGLAYIGGIGGPSPNYKSLPSKADRY